MSPIGTGTRFGSEKEGGSIPPIPTYGVCSPKEEALVCETSHVWVQDPSITPFGNSSNGKTLRSERNNLSSTLGLPAFADVA